MAENKDGLTEKKKVLIVDDDLHIIELVKDILAGANYTIISALSAKEARRILESERVDIMIIDIMLEDNMSGYELCKQIKQNKETAGVPVMMLSAKSQLDDKLLAVDAGADDYIIKPFTIEELIKRVRTNLASKTTD